MNRYRFYKIGKNWYIDLPDYIEQGGTLGDLQMVDGADKMLDVMSGAGDTVELTISKEIFCDSDVLELIERCDPAIGGGYYFMRKFEGTDVNQMIWLCQVTAFVLNDILPKIFVRKEKPYT